MIRMSRARVLWSTARSYPGSWPIRRFKRYIRSVEFPTHYYYNAYPGASVRDVLSALVLARELKLFDDRIKESDPDSFNREYVALLTRVGNYMPTTGVDLDRAPASHEYVQPIDE